MSYVLMIVGRVAGEANTEFDGKYVVEYDPDRRGRSPEGHEMLAHIKVTADPTRAVRFDLPGDAMDLWRRTSTRWPTRPDGQPNRPLTAFTVTVLRLSDHLDAQPGHNPEG